MLTINIETHFDAAHFLPEPYEGKCSRMHGHRYRLIVGWLVQEIDQIGLSVDFSKLKERLTAYLATYDHSVLNTTMNDRPTAEVMVLQIAKELDEITREEFPSIELFSVKLYETPDCFAIWMLEKEER